MRASSDPAYPMRQLIALGRRCGFRISAAPLTALAGRRSPGDGKSAAYQAGVPPSGRSEASACTPKPALVFMEFAHTRTDAHACTAETSYDDRSGTRLNESSAALRSRNTYRHYANTYQRMKWSNGRSQIRRLALLPAPCTTVAASLLLRRHPRRAQHGQRPASGDESPALRRRTRR